MQPNIIDLTVDPLNNGTTEVQNYRRFSDSDNRALYIGDDHTGTKRDTLTLLRSLPKTSGTFKGMMKTSAKFTLDIEVPSTVVGVSVIAPYIVDISVSLPVGTDPVVAQLVRQRVVALMDKEAVVKNLHELQEI